MAKKLIFHFSEKGSEGSSSDKNLLGGKGANLAEMSNLGLPVPPGFTISTEACGIFQDKETIWDELQAEIDSSLTKLEASIGKGFGDEKNPLLVSVRSGAPISMPGMMDTVLNLGLNDKTFMGLAEQSEDKKFALDSYRRFIEMYANIVDGMDREIFMEESMDLGDVDPDEMDEEKLETVLAQYKEIYKKHRGVNFPQDPRFQLTEAIKAVFSSWNSKRAIAYRRIHNIAGGLGTAVNVQSMVFGNLGQNSATGVLFSRNPSTGERRLYGEYLPCAQGEDVVAGIRTGYPLLKEDELSQKEVSLERAHPEIFGTLGEITKKLESNFKDMQDIEFTIEKGKLYLLQCRNGKRSAKSAIKIACDMYDEGLISKEDAIRLIDPDQLPQLLHPSIVPDAEKEQIATGLPASPGAASGRIVFFAEEAKQLSERGEKVILVRVETSPEDIEGMHCSEGILTARGGMTSHAAVVARGMGKCCVAGCSSIKIHYREKVLEVGNRRLIAGDVITLDGTSGDVYLGRVPMVNSAMDENLERIMEWADEFRKLKIMANADNAHDASVSIQFGAEGIALCRTEHMFFEKDRISSFRRMILSQNEEMRISVLKELKSYQKEDFKDLFKAMQGLPITIRLLDPPLHEFLPHDEEEAQDLALEMHQSLQHLLETINDLKEFNPMLGHRGCRLGLSHPEIYKMQCEAITEAVIECQKEGIKSKPKIMIPLVGFAKELAILKEEISELLERYAKENSIDLDIPIGTMIELPRACLQADKIADHADFFSFGTNDLTQTCLGISRDDSGRFLQPYQDNGIIENDPFIELDQDGVGELLKIAIEKGRSVKPDLDLGICGEHGGEPKSIGFAASIGMDYVSCSTFRIPIARLTAARVELMKGS